MLGTGIFCNATAALFEKLIKISLTYKKENMIGVYTMKWTYRIVPEYAVMKKTKQGVGRGKRWLCVCVWNLMKSVAFDLIKNTVYFISFYSWPLQS